MVTSLPPNPETGDRLNGGCLDSLPTAPCAGSGNNVAYARSFHPGGAHAVMGDGAVKFVLNSVDSTTWQRVGTRAGGQDVSADW